MNGDRMSAQQAHDAVGQHFAGHVYAGVGDGTWLTREVVCFTEQPTITIRADDGTTASYAVSTIKDWATGDKPSRPPTQGCGEVLLPGGMYAGTICARPVGHEGCCGPRRPTDG